MSPRATERLSKRSKKSAIQEAISNCIETTMSEWKRTGKIGNSSPKTSDEASKQASGLCYAEARSKAGSAKVPKA